MRVNKVSHFSKALDWIKANTVDGKGIAVTSKKQVVYPEVSGYYIPSLLQWGERELALAYARHLCSIQKPDGSWYDSADKAPYVFDSAQILKGLLAVRGLLPEADAHILKGCDWILSNMRPDGRLVTPSKDAWGNNEDFCSELIHVYCLTPLRDAGELFGRPKYSDAARRILAYYKANKLDRIENFSLLSHFYAYVMEGLFDLGETDLCRRSMERLEKHRDGRGAIPGLNNVSWICSTGLFQLALVWYKLGELEKGNSLFDYVLGLQNESGGWYGSYPAPGLLARLRRNRNTPIYFPDAEISWACKYFLDALALKEKLEFEKQAPIFLDEIGADDGRYTLIRKLVHDSGTRAGRRITVCDVGCGKGRYLKRLVRDCPEAVFCASDISAGVMAGIDFVKEKRVCGMTDISYDDASFDVVYACESFEHAINQKAAFRELYRIAKPGGVLTLVDKPEEKLGTLEIDEWERWISGEEIASWTAECGGQLEIVESVPYDGKDDGLFRAWVVSKPL